jgi:hypothetical protein
MERGGDGHKCVCLDARGGGGGAGAMVLASASGGNLTPSGVLGHPPKGLAWNSSVKGDSTSIALIPSIQSRSAACTRLVLLSSLHTLNPLSTLHPAFILIALSAADGVWYTDANGLEWQQRKLGHRPAYSFQDSNIPGNLYPMTTGKGSTAHTHTHTHTHTRSRSAPPHMRYTCSSNNKSRLVGVCSQGARQTSLK